MPLTYEKEDTPKSRLARPRMIENDNTRFQVRSNRSAVELKFRVVLSVFDGYWDMSPESRQTPIDLTLRILNRHCREDIPSPSREEFAAAPSCPGL
jgi:hypothetical protein